MRKHLVAVALLLVLPRLLEAALPPWHVSTADLNKARAVLREGLKSDEFWPAMHAAEAMTVAGLQKEVVAHLKPKLAAEKDDQRRCGLARELVRAGHVEYADKMFDILRSDDPHGHVHAAESLYKVGWVGGYEPLRSAFAESNNVTLRLMAAGALAKHGSPDDREKALQYLRSVLSDSEIMDEYRIAAWVLARTGDSRDVARLRMRLSDAEDEKARAFIQNALAALGDLSGQQQLHEDLSAEDAAFRTYAATFAGDAGMIGVIPDLVLLLDDPNLDTRIRAAQS
ncbi:hypothetical protein N9023_06815, partial [Opitutaceae bacterium]|nr:hypothetical protein [Opitutaceae bacterium]